MSDRYGFNNPNDEWDNDVIDYVLVGDSHAHGNCVNRPDDIASVLRNLSNKSALTIGYGSNGPLIEYAALREYLDRSMKNIFWFYYEGNDIENLNHELKNDILLNYLNNNNFTQNLKIKQNQVDKLNKERIKKEIKIKAKDQAIYKKKLEKEKKLINKLLKFFKLSSTRYVIFYKPKFETPNLQPELKQILKKANNLAISNGSNFYFVYLPTFVRYKFDKNDKNYLYLEENYKSIKNFINQLNIPFIDIHKQVFQKEKDPRKLFSFGMQGYHPTEEGYRKITEAIYNFYMKNL